MNDSVTMTAEKNAFCGSPLWDEDRGSNSTGPHLTECFQNTVLVYVPCGYLFLVTPFYFCVLVHCRRSHVAHSWLNIAKTVLCCALMLLCLTGVVKHVYSHFQGEPLYAALILSPAINSLAMLLATALIQFGRKKGVRSTGVLFVYWLMQTVAAVFIIMAQSMAYVQDSQGDVYALVWTSLFGVLVLVQLILASLVDQPPVHPQTAPDPSVCPEGSTSFLSVISFWWFTSLVIRGYRHSLERSDLWSLDPEHRAKNIVPKFEVEWMKEVSKSQRSRESQSSKTRNSYPDGQMALQPLNEGDVTVEVKQPARKTYQPRLMFAMMRTYGAAFSLAACLKLVHDILMFVSPFLLKLLIQYTYSHEVAEWKGYMYAVLLFVTAFIQSLLLQQYFHRCLIVGTHIRTAFIATVYKKALRLTSASRRSSTVGEIVNLMSVDAQRFIELTTYLHMIWSAPFQMCVCMYFLWMTLGPSILAGVAVMVLLIPVNALIAKRTKTLQVAQMVHKDERIKVMNEVLNGIKVLKLYAWELSFRDKVLDTRNKELIVLKKAAYLNAASSFTWACAPFLVSVTTFAVYVLSSPDNVLDAEKAFVSLSLFNILRFPLGMLPMLIANMVQAKVSIDRLQGFLKLDELDPSNVDHTSSTESAVSIREGTFTWDESQDESALTGIDLQVAPGSLVAVVGTVGCGKSSLISAILGEMQKLEGQVIVKGSVAYVAQQAWIQNATLRDNILFTRAKQDTLYAQVLEACALNPDLQILPDADLTEIGEKGINLSGGQKQRVSLARAVYTDADVYLLDDPLSAVDSHVGKHIFEKLLGPKGMLQNKTRILVTHGLTFLPQVDQIVVLVNGRVSEVGTYRQLLDKDGAFAEFLRTYLAEEAGEDKEEEMDTEELAVKEDILSHIGSVDKINRVRHDTSTSTPDATRRTRKDTVRSNTSQLSGSRASLHTSRASLNRTQSKNLAISSKEREAKMNGTLAQEKGKESDRLIKEETTQEGVVKLSVFLSYIKAIGVPLSAVIILMYVIYNCCQVGTNFWLSDWSDDSLLNRSASADQRNMRLGVYAALGLAQGLAVYVATFLLAYGAMLASAYLHLNILRNILHSPMLFFDTTPMGRILNRFSKDMDVVDTLVPKNIEFWVRCTFHVIATLVVVCYSTPIVLVAITPLAVLYYFVQRFYVATSRQLKRLESVSRSPMYSHFGETLQGTSTIRAYRQQEGFIAESEARVNENQTCYYPGIVSNRWLAIRLEIVGNCIVFFAALFAVIGRDRLTAGVVGLSISYALNITQTLNWMVRMTSELETNIVAVERVKEYSEVEGEADWVVEDSRPPADWPARGEMQIQGYGTRYRDNLDLVLHDITCHFAPGEKIGIVGRTGAGKSSLTVGLFRIIEPAMGTITIDGVDIANIGLHDLRSKLTIIPQDPVVFSGTLRMNLDPFEKNTDQELWTALEHAHLKDFVASLSEGLMYECAEGGDNLSVGQRQLLCLARALLRKTRILILDEATAAVDLETDDLIQSTIRTEFKECTVLTIAHRLNTIMDYNRVLVLEGGHIAEFDSPQKLLSDKQSKFYSMAKDADLVD